MVNKGQIYTKRPLQNALKQLNRRVWSLRKDFFRQGGRTVFEEKIGEN